MPDARASHPGSGDQRHQNVHRDHLDAGRGPQAAGPDHRGAELPDAVFPDEVRRGAELPDEARRDAAPREEPDEHPPVAARPDVVLEPDSRRRGCYRPTADAAPGPLRARRTAAHRLPFRARVPGHLAPLLGLLRAWARPDLASRLAVGPGAGPE
ncbi:hypothetical protein CLV47_102256 [Antricoccus suffuscus]|uniref:Uncharacterized protein n=1 Tax=Antricoccus suffuscus TaxID=1629062 RepID=A0A2T1A5F0_9ACTN|nr:hypothetical protein CLV47_102256 [Antricoccus suffuscus]